MSISAESGAGLLMVLALVLTTLRLDEQLGAFGRGEPVNHTCEDVGNPEASFGFASFDHLGHAMLVLFQSSLPDAFNLVLHVSLQAEPGTAWLTWLYYFVITGERQLARQEQTAACVAVRVVMWRLRLMEHHEARWCLRHRCPCARIYETEGVCPDMLGCECDGLGLGVFSQGLRLWRVFSFGWLWWWWLRQTAKVLTWVCACKAFQPA